ncbi:bacillithiol biosynthesis cysteine-adding enzyme BshC [Paenibacillus cellulosilyticus]|uniref:Putative cysteine ligase BshC n=1 Tax=Paenibacillus cellulosilyticus TaxID=375489 RepID=A0A2V2YM95_9BACL|nr:bacillithiol biosynthesis cysteine-adding enzyme BshC [Paenibacillus cellulosilyticus]PWV95454.1 bacillithiol biosynthesis cysteine-adding enzyme BshC [Paenibacillus cellulosilyticus]QKS43171.1 bacillithiol biosynthesis cysteine-adding enzyme BshC [Paenibacillus cellulosilyticus]
MTSTETYELPVSQPLSEAYVQQSDRRLGELFHSGHPSSDEAWRKRADYLDRSAHLRATASDIAGVLRAYNSRFGMTAEVASNIDALGEGALVVVGGQQAGLWTGPLLVIHKAVTVLTAAKHASSVLGRTVVPVFWIAGEDHDWEEANHVMAVSDQGLRKLAIARPDGPRTSVSRTAVSSETWEAAIEELAATLPGSEFKEGLLDKLRSISASSGTLSESFAHHIMLLFGSEGLVLMDADDKLLRAVEAPMFRRILSEQDSLGDAYSTASARLKELGYPTQAAYTPGCANLFLFRPDNDAIGLKDERVLLYKREDGSGFTDRKGESNWSQEQLLGLAESKPEQLSNNVLTRPIMQDYVLPVLAAVLGPGEIAYWAQLGEAFRHFDMEMPILAPRMSFTLVEGTVAKHMLKYELTFDDIVTRFEEKKQAWLDSQDRFDIAAKFGHAKEQFEQLYTPLVALAAEVQAGLEKLGQTNMSKIIEQISYLESKTADAFRKSHDASLRHWERIGLAIWPAGKPQERALNMTAYWNRYGLDWLQKLLELPYDPQGGHRVIYL